MSEILSSGEVLEVMNCWRDMADQSYDIFGVDCEIIYLKKKISYTASPNNNIPEFSSINYRRRSMPNEYDILDQTVEEQEVKENIKIKIYWDAKSWYKTFGFTSIPEDHVMILSKMSDSEKMNNGLKIRFTDVNSNSYEFEKVSKAIPYGFEKNRYCSSVWKY